MSQRLLQGWWLVGAMFIGLALPLAAIMVAIDHRRHRDWPTTGLAVLWCVLALGCVGVVQGNLSPPLFGVPLVLLYTFAWTRSRTVFTLGVLGAYGLSAWIVIHVARQQPGEVQWLFLVAWLASLAALVFWHTRRPSAAVP